MLNNIFDELKEVNTLKKSQLSRVLQRKNFKEIKRLKSLQVKAEAYFEPKASIYDEVSLWIYLTSNYFCNKSFIIDVWLGYI